jgi:hypothetical protein
MDAGGAAGAGLRAAQVSSVQGGDISPGASPADGVLAGGGAPGSSAPDSGCEEGPGPSRIQGDWPASSAGGGGGTVPVTGGGEASVAPSTTSDGGASLRWSAGVMGDCSTLRPTPPLRFLRPAANETSKPTSTRPTKIALTIVTQLSKNAASGKDAGAMPMPLADSENPATIRSSFTARPRKGMSVPSPYSDLTIPDRCVAGKGSARMGVFGEQARTAQ